MVVDELPFVELLLNAQSLLYVIADMAGSPPPLVNPVMTIDSSKLFLRVRVFVAKVPPVTVVNPDILIVFPEFEFRANVPKRL